MLSKSLHVINNNNYYYSKSYTVFVSYLQHYFIYFTWLYSTDMLIFGTRIRRPFPQTWNRHGKFSRNIFKNVFRSISVKFGNTLYSNGTRLRLQCASAEWIGANNSAYCSVVSRLRIIISKQTYQLGIRRKNLTKRFDNITFTVTLPFTVIVVENVIC